MHLELGKAWFNVKLDTQWIISDINLPDNLLTGAKHPQLNITRTNNNTNNLNNHENKLPTYVQTKTNETEGAFYAIWPGNG